MYMFLSFIVAFVFMFFPTLIAICKQDWYNVAKIGMLNIALVLVSLVINVNFTNIIDAAATFLFWFSFFLLIEEDVDETK